MKEYVKMFESGGFGDSRFHRVASLMHAYLLAWREYGYGREPNMGIVRMDAPALIDSDPGELEFFGTEYVDDNVGLPSAAFLALLSEMVEAHAAGDDDAFTDAFETASSYIADRKNAKIPHYELLDYLLYMMYTVGVTELGARGGAEEWDEHEGSAAGKEIVAMDQDTIFDKVKRGIPLQPEEEEFLKNMVGESLVPSFRGFCLLIEKKTR